MRLTVGDFTQTQPFRIRIDPRLDGTVADPMAEYAELDRLSASLLAAATEMAEGIAELRRVKEQVEFTLDVARSTEVPNADGVIEGAQTLDQTVDEWIAKLLQKELKTFQNAYQHEARLLMKYKDLLGRIGGANIPVTDGVKEVTGDYLTTWSAIEAELQAIKSEDIPAFNELLEAAGLPLIYLPRPVT